MVLREKKLIIGQATRRKREKNDAVGLPAICKRAANRDV